mmetsp:Transcript_13077/g.21405  ORF Transcript_13077/g.21405 Transcript_13077/m.21405 type:complete len:993 (-) Transcript_13077:448-3426(-)
MPNECIQVVVRMRPFNSKEKNEGRGPIIDMAMDINQIAIKNPDDLDNPNPKSFTFDAVYDDKTQQRPFYDESCFNLVESVLEGFNGTIFAYGQTGCGKTFTMQGPLSPPEMKGVIPNSFTHIFDSVKAKKLDNPNCEYLIHCSFLEIYNEVIRDLLQSSKDPPKCDLKEDPVKGIIVSNLLDKVVETEEQCDELMSLGLANRTVGSTAMNAESSRSHSIFTIIVEVNEKDEAGKDHIKAGKLNLVDLAGSERQKKTGASGDRLKEGSKINLSLSALGNVISALSEGKGKHIPYRDSKLTRMLQDSLGGNTKTLMVAAISPADYNFDETMSTLRYANRAKSIKNKPKINEDPKDTMIREYKEEIEKLKQMLASFNQAGVNLNAMSAFMSGSSKNIVDSDASPQQQQKIETNSSNAGGENRKDDSAVDFSVLAAPCSEVDGSPRIQGNGNSSPRFSSAPVTNESSGSLNFAALVAANADNKVEKSPRTMKRSPRGDQLDNASSNRSPRRNKAETKETVRYEKEYVEVKVEVDRIPSDHLNKHQELLEHASYIEEEREYLGEQLSEMEKEVIKERQEREQLQMRLQLLQQKFGDGSMTELLPTLSPTKGLEVSTEDDEVRLKKELETKKDREAAQVRMRDRKAKMKRKQEAKKRAEEERMMREKEEEVQKEADDNDLDKAVAKIKKKYNKKINAARAEIDDLHEEFQMEREDLLDNIRESNKDCELFRQICIGLLGETKLRKLIDKSRYDSDDEEWIIPHVKKKDSDDRLPGIGGGNVLSSENNSRANSARNSRPESGSGHRRNKNRQDLDAQEKGSPNPMYYNDQKDDKSYDNGSNVPTLTIPRHAPSKPPIGAKNSARRNEKKKSKNENEGYMHTDLAPPQDEGGSGIRAGQLSDWGFAGGQQNQNGIMLDNSELEVDPSLALNHMGGQNIGDRQSSRHGSRSGSRKSGRKSAGQKRKSHNAPCSNDSNGSAESFGMSGMSPRSSQGTNLPKL